MRICLNLFLLILIVIWLSPAFSSEPKEVAEGVKLYEKGELDQLEKRVPDLVVRYPDNPDVIYFKALFTRDGEEALRLFKRVHQLYPKSRFASEALYRVYQYYFARGYYKKATEIWATIEDNYPSLANRKGDEKVQGGGVEPRAQPSLPRYTVQIGAFADRKNAERLQIKFKENYTTTIAEKTVDNRTFYLVWVGRFQDRESALQFGQKMKKTHGIPFQVVER
ncbi:SPOR domain-containing protein [candidate division KSB1 bacterium]|nr:SPOR domain-containing protein [candidate division KSB1 bacterium]